MTEPKHRQRLAAILAADAAGYSRLMSLDDHATVSALDAARGVFKRAIESNKGRVIDMAGDSVLAVFETATGAVKTAVDVQDALQSSGQTVVGDEQLKFRIGVHLGDVLEKDDGSIYGDGVNIAARLEALAEPGGVVISDAVHSAVRGRVVVGFDDAGEHRVKNIAHPVRAYAVNSSGTGDRRPGLSVNNAPRFGKRAIRLTALIGIVVAGFAASWWAVERFWASDANEPGAVASEMSVPTVAVLKFRRFDTENDSLPLSESFAEELIHELARDKDFRVISRHSSFSEEAAGKSAEQVAQLLGATYIVDGRVGVKDNLLRVQMSMADGRNGHIVWTDKSSTTVENLDVTRARQIELIAGTLRTGIKTNEERSVMRRKTSDLDVYTLTLSVMARKHTFRPDQYRLARQEGQQALDIDPNYAPAWTNLAYLNFVDVMGQVTGEWSFPRLGEVDAFLERSVGIDPLQPVAWQVRSVLRGIQGRRADALQAAQRAVELAPNDADGLLYLAVANAMADRIDEGAHYIDRSRALFPIPPVHYLSLGARVMWAAKQYERAIEMSRRCKQQTPQFFPCWPELLASLIESDRLDEARQTMEEMTRYFPNAKDPLLTKAFAGSPLEGRRRAAATVVASSAQQQ